jgi:hypothetical protein
MLERTTAADATQKKKKEAKIKEITDSVAHPPFKII